MTPRRRPYTLDHAKAQRAVDFIQALRHTKGRWAGRRFLLDDFQERIIRDVFGRMTPEQVRLIRKLFLEIARKNGKSELAAAIGLYLVFADDEPGAEIYGAAEDRTQASIVFDVAASMVRRSPPLLRRCEIVDYRKRIVVPRTESFYQVLAADTFGRKSHGYNPHGILFDELHTQTRRDFFDALMTAFGTRAQPLAVEMTTAGYDRHSICYEEHEYARKVLAGIIEDPTFYPVIYAAEEDDAFDDEDAWRKANPALGSFLSLEFLRAMARRAKHSPASQNTFRRLFLNVWTQAVSRWVDRSVWDANGGPVPPLEKLRRRTCWGGLDLGAVKDLTAYVLLFPAKDDPGHLLVVARFWCPETWLTSEENQYRDQYQLWHQMGLLETTPGQRVDWRVVQARIERDAELFDLRQLAVDRWKADELALELEDAGIDVVAVGQGYASMSEPMKEFEGRLLEHRFSHGGNAVLRFMADSLAVREDSAGNLKPDKAESQGRIDGISALLNALSRVMLTQPEEESVYSKRGVRAV